MNSYGNTLKITIFGQSHGPAIGVVIDGFPAGITPDMEALQRFLARRAPGGASYATPRKEADMPEFIAGLADGKTCGAPITAIIRNTDTRSFDYGNLRDVPRPSQADYSAYMKFHGHNDIAGSGQFSGRLTAPLCIAGGLCLQLLGERGMQIGAHILSIGTVDDDPFDPVHPAFSALPTNTLPVLNAAVWEKMLREIETAKAEEDSVGGVIECAVTGLPAGCGSPMFEGIENRIAQIVFGIPAVKGVSFGSGFEGSRRRGSQNNDPFVMDGDTVRTKTNNHGGILGGITTGMPLLFRAAFKPTSSIGIEQDSVSLSRRENVKLTIQGRHDPCIVPRAVPVVEAAAAVAICDI
ncbi:MAG: chorismate synthase, partial [Firmicutes bacterium]|nr:chorismate synthase [Bacillota bacterium]